MMTRRSFLRRSTLAVGAVVTASYTGLDFLSRKVPAVDALAQALGLRHHGGILEWDVEYCVGEFLPALLVKTEMNIPEHREPPLLTNWAGIQYDRWKFDINTQRVWYLRK